MKIPKNIKIIGRNIKIEYMNEELDRNGNDGLCVFDEGKIHIKNNYKNNDELYITFLHELLHWILYLIKHNDYNNESFIGAFSEVLYQVIQQIER